MKNIITDIPRISGFTTKIYRNIKLGGMGWSYILESNKWSKNL